MLHWLQYIFSEIFRNFDEKVTKKYVINCLRCDKVNNMGKSIGQNFCKEKTRILSLLISQSVNLEDEGGDAHTTRKP